MKTKQEQLSVDMDNWMMNLLSFINNRNPDLNSLAVVYINEAKFGRRFIDDNLKQLAVNSQILEVGAGSLLLSTQLVKEGYAVTALEPVGVGFSHFSQLQLLVLEFAEIHHIKPTLLNLHVENLNETSKYDFAFSINVMEHVGSVQTCIKRVTDALKTNAHYRFTCPNYTFPYEPHFNIPTLFNKKLTEIIFKNKIYKNLNVPDPKGVWESLNWINVRQVKKIISVIPSVRVSFNKSFFGESLRRLAYDAEFSSRRSGFIVNLASFLCAMRLDWLMQCIPVAIQPIIDCTIIKNNQL